MNTQTLYVPVSTRTGIRALPFDSLTMASLWVISQGEPGDWTVVMESVVTEEWRPIPGYEGVYSINRSGDIRRDLINKGQNLYPSIRIDNAGYRRVKLHKNGGGFSMAIHRALALAFIPNPESKPEVNHIYGDKLNNSLGNLEWSTRGENMRHKARVLGGTTPKKIPDDQIWIIRSLRHTGHRLASIAKIFGVSFQLVSQIYRGKNRTQLLLGEPK